MFLRVLITRRPWVPFIILQEVEGKPLLSIVAKEANRLEK
jgi:hypothetical protein